MPKTLTLLQKALAIKTAADWTRELNLERSTLSQAKKRGRLSPVLAGTFAERLNEDVTRWMAVAALEAETDSPLKERLLRRARTWLRAPLRWLANKRANHSQRRSGGTPRD
jgi:hypothetical protein